VILTWNANVETNIVGYKLYYGPVSSGTPPGAGRYANVLNVGNVTMYMVSNLVQGITYGFAVTAYNNLGKESDLSPEVTYVKPPTEPLKVTSFKMIQSNSPPAGIRNGLQLTWRSEPGGTYRVLYKTNLTQSAWMQLSPNALATTTNTSWVDWLPATGFAARRFYVVQMVP